jgi:sterol desaturase/sphingolipid hydroxylase (fatty acid hydroxylase superfamily)
VSDSNSWIDLTNAGAVLFPAAFLLVALWEIVRPARSATISFSARWFSNIALLGFTWIIATVLPFMTSFGAALVASQQGWGLLNAVPVPVVIAIPLSVVMLDLLGYWEHRLFHAVPFLWRLHALHHSDQDLDVTTSIRHHPFEVLVQMSLDAAVTIAFGFPPMAVAVYGVAITVVQAIHHGNIDLPRPLVWIRTLIVTPDLHRVHHSMAFDENNSNFSNFLTLWDRLFGTLRVRTSSPLRLGLAEFAGAKFQRLDKILMTPWLVSPPQSLVSPAPNNP